MQIFSCEYCEISKDTCFEEHLPTAVSEVTLGSDCLGNNPDSVILRKYQLLSNQRFKHNSTHMSSLNLTPTLSFEPRFCMFIMNGYDRKSKRM